MIVFFIVTPWLLKKGGARRAPFGGTHAPRMQRVVVVQRLSSHVGRSWSLTVPL
ncbi:MAG: hypothetical protein QFF03_05330 [Pseudomonadota bacterium]|nr:hypothetical protein [Pseudomonadota bacterium]